MKKIHSGTIIRLLICFGLPLAVLFMPIDSIPIDDLTLIQHRLLAIFLLAALLWVLEPVPVFATSILIIALELIMISDKACTYFAIHPPGMI
ncbi:transporter putative [Vibrio ponticus]|nr:transporter putative [Vibrio ponticus]